jgi:raffinose/stachyose/melibiose transport system permease protein
MKIQKIGLSAMKNLISVLLSIIMLLPISLVLINAFKTKSESSTMSFNLPSEWHWENFLTVIDRGKLVNSFFNSMLYSVASVALIVLFASMAAYVISRKKTTFMNWIYIYIVMGLTLTLNHIALIKIMETLQLLGTRGGIIILYTASQIPFATFIFYSFISTVPRELDEAAVIDGCGPISLYFRIVFPLLKPAVVSVAILNFLNTWNEFTLPLYYLTDSSKWPMTNSIYSFYGQFSANWHLVCADILLTCLPVVIIYLLGQKYIVEGMTSGAVKG